MTHDQADQLVQLEALARWAQAAVLVRDAQRRDRWRNIMYSIWTVVGVLALIAWQW